MRNLVAVSLVALLLLACDPCEPAPAPPSETGTDEATDSTETTANPADSYCCNCPSGECWGEPDKEACGALTAASGEQHGWCEGTVQECLSECKVTTVCCQCEPTPPSCQVWPFGEVQCLASAGASAIWCEDATVDGCAMQCG